MVAILFERDSLLYYIYCISRLIYITESSGLLITRVTSETYIVSGVGSEAGDQMHYDKD